MFRLSNAVNFQCIFIFTLSKEDIFLFPYMSDLTSYDLPDTSF